jgi:hypothetical protein
MSMTKEQRQELVNEYINCVLDNMDITTMEIFISDVIDGELQEYTDEQLATHIGEQYPRLLEK